MQRNRQRESERRENEPLSGAREAGAVTGCRHAHRQQQRRRVKLGLGSIVPHGRHGSSRERRGDPDDDRCAAEPAREEPGEHAPRERRAYRGQEIRRVRGRQEPEQLAPGARQQHEKGRTRRMRNAQDFDRRDELSRVPECETGREGGDVDGEKERSRQQCGERGRPCLRV